MSIWKKTVLMMVAAMTIGGGVSLAAGPATSPVTSTSVDVKGPCDEPEHATDPECAGPQTPEDNGVNDDNQTGVDISGPCDEAEHAGAPRCTGAVVPGDNSGPGNGDDGREDRSGPSENSGPGNAGDDDDNSGPGSGGDDDDNSGPGSGDDG
jgi:hypothetical protein